MVAISKLVQPHVETQLNEETIRKAERVLKMGRINSPGVKDKSPLELVWEADSSDRQSESNLLTIKKRDDDAHQELIRQLRYEVRELKKENVALVREVRGLKQQGDSQKKQNEALIQRIEMLSKAISENRQKLEEKAKENKHLGKVIDEQRGFIKQLESDIQRKNTDIQTLMSERREQEKGVL